MTALPDITAALERGEIPDYALLTAQTSRNDLLRDARARAWLRRWPALDAELADALLEHEDDFRQTRRDTSLRHVVERASLMSIEQHALAIAAGSGAAALWERLAATPDHLVRVAETVVSVGSPVAAESALYLLVIDPLDPYALGAERRAMIARAALASQSAEVRGAGAEFLGEDAPELLLEQFDALVMDDNERVRGVVWLAALRAFRRAAYEHALTLLGDEHVPTPIRRSALVAIGTQMPTSDMIDILSYLVMHPDPVLAEDAASLLYSHHRNPFTAEVARESPHEHVREIAEILLDPLRGSPAAGGSRPGDPTRTTDIFREMVEHLEDRTREHDREHRDQG